MTDIKYHLAQANIAKMLAPLDDPIMEGFANQLEYINRMADICAGWFFNWHGKVSQENAAV